MDNAKLILKRISDKMGFSTNKELSDYLNTPYDTLNNWIKRDSIPLKTIEKVVQNEQLSYDWIFTGKNENNVSNDNVSNGYKIDVLNIKASAGTGIENHIVEVIDTIILDKNLFKSPINPNKIKLIQVSGDSMFPTLNDGDFVVIDETKSYGVDGIYAINLHNQILIKRLKFKLDGTIQIISDNKEYEMEVYNPNETQIPLHIIGLKTLTIQR
ncbi:LexA family transcriptional regulator [Aliarcobacter butzleri]|uniref:LexA family transcriptional regulator n=1 Tax=Aliarcobacter butzleri TaxID=28197 RepID=UPI0020949EFE|nr:LexA family transcriptional regulator [Aliarcobacter butzleri]